MRSLLIALTLLIPAAADAQRIHGAAPTPPVTQTPAGATHQTPPPPQTPASKTMPPPSAFPLPPLMTPPAGGLTSGFPGSFTHAFNPSRTKPSRRRRPIVAPIYAAFVPASDGTDEAVDGAGQEGPPVERDGALRLAVTPETAQVFVDGFFVATIEDLGVRQELALESGLHRIEVRAPQYQTASFDVRIAPRETIAYRGSLEPAPMGAATRLPAAPPPVTGPIYVIPNCYMGNVPPRADRLPAGCDVTQVQVIRQP